MYFDERTENLPAPVVHRPMPEPWQQSLLEAAQYLRNHVWLQHKWQAPGGAACMVQALSYVSGDIRYGNAFQALHRVMNDPMDWNDAHGRTKEQVIDMLEHVAGV